MPAKKRKTVTELNAYLVRRIDLFAAGILESATAAKDPALSIPERLEVLNTLGKWLAVRNRIADNQDSEGMQLNDYRRHLLKTNATQRKAGFPSSPDKNPGDFVTRPYGRRPLDIREDNDGSALADLRARLPGADAGGDDDDRDDAVGEDDPDIGDGGGVRADLSGDQPGDDNGADRERDL